MTLNPNSGIGRAVMNSLMGLKTLGRVFLVVPNTHPNYSDIQAVFSPDGTYGDVILFPDPASAYADTISNRGDIIVVAPGTYTLSSMLTITNSGVKFIALDYLMGEMPIRSQQAVITFAGTSGSSNVATLLINTVNGFGSFGIKWTNSSTIAQSTNVVVTEGSTGVYFESSAIMPTGSSAVFGSTSGCSLAESSESSIYRNCLIGTNNTANTVANSVIYLPASGGVAEHRAEFTNCIVETFTTSTSGTFVKQPNLANVYQNIEFNNTRFLANRTGASAATPANGIIGVTASTANGDILLTNCQFGNVTAIHGASVNVYADAATGILA